MLATARLPARVRTVVTRLLSPARMAGSLTAAPEAGLTAHWNAKYASDETGTSFSWTQTDSMRSMDLVEAELSRADAAGAAQSVVDVGGGMSGLAKGLVRLHSAEGATPVRVAVHDISSQALKGSAAAMTEHERSMVAFECGNILEAKLAPASVDVWHDRAAFHFLTEPADQAAYVRIAGDSVKRGGAVVLAAFDSDGGPLRCSGLPVRRWDAEGLAKAFSEGGFSLTHTEREVHTTPAGSSQRFVYVVLRKD